MIFSSQISSGNLKGNIYALICVNLFALTFVILSQYNNAHRFSITAIAGLSGMLISYFFINDFTLEINTLLIFLLTGLFVSPTSRILILIRTKTLPASEISILMIIETVMAPIWVWLVLDEIPYDSTFLGGSIILMTLFLNSLYTLKRNKDEIASIN
ncbi:EamA family transporter [Sulfurimonas sp.]|uniref:EamA family transporter n=1 Tax=Sulfurimonas sp. TaxID=2022749 RepID=UPI0025FCF3C9|nr:EamA family transporter [Sulfurimonas sp.]